MNFGLNTFIYASPLTTADFETIAPKIKEMGFDWIEAPIEGLDDLDYVRAAEIAKEYDLGVSCCAAMGPDRDLVHPDPAIIASGMDYIIGCIDGSAVIGATNLVGPIYSSVGRTWQMTDDERAKTTDLLVENLTKLSAYANDNGVVLCLEPLNRFETSFINLASQAIEVVDRVDSPACKIMLDTFHMNIEEKSQGDAIRAVGDRLVHFHACGSDRGTPGSGTIQWDDVQQGLKDINYDGPVVIESFTPKVKSIARAAAIWRPLAASSDALASDGVNFLKGLLA